jgi:hypothetical protein
MANADTPNLHLIHGTDADVNANWDKLDAAYKALGARTIIPDDLLIQGNLEVQGNAVIDGILTALGGFDPGIQPVHFGTLDANNASFNGPVTFQPGSIDGTALAPNAAIYTAQSGNAQTAQVPIPVSPGVQLATLLMNPVDDPARWELILAQVTLQIGLNSVANVSNQIQLILRRGGVSGADQQSRNFPFTLTQPGFLSIPLTIVRLAKPPTLDEPRWTLNALVTSPPGSTTYASLFAQVHVIQFR